MRRELVAIGIAASLTLTACESGTSAPPTNPDPAPSFSLSPSKSALSTPRGWNAILDIAINRTGGFTAGVQLSVEGSPPGVSASFATPSVPALGVSARLTIDVDSAAVIGTYPLTIRATGTGVSAASTVVTLVVPKPSFALDLDPAVSVRSTSAVGFIATINATVVRDNGFRGPITLEASGLPPDVALVGSPAIGPNDNQAQVILSIGASTPPGSYPIVVRGTGSEVDPRTATVNVVIPPR